MVAGFLCILQSFRKSKRRALLKMRCTEPLFARGLLLFSCFVLICCEAQASTPKHCAASNSEKLHFVTAREFKLDRLKGTSSFSGAVRYRRGREGLSSEHLQIHKNKNRLLASKNVRYTSCLSKSPAWFLSADKILLDREKEVVRALKPTVYIAGIPFLSLPYFQLSLGKERRSGFLTPELDYSSQHGAEVGFPYYFNLAPNADFLFRPTYMSKRGVQVGGTFRYLLPFGEGDVQSDWLDDDDYGSDRYSYRWRHDSKISDSLGISALLHRVSDLDYSQDFLRDKNLLYDGYLPSWAGLDYVWKGWRLKLFAENLQRARGAYPSADSIYQRDFDIGLSGDHFFQSLDLHVHTLLRWTGFAADPSLSGERQGKRLSGQFEMQKFFRKSWGYLAPGFGVRHSRYSLKGVDDQSLTVPLFSLRGKLLFENHHGNRHFTSALEPEFMYLYVPHKSQEQLPNFDTGYKEFSYDRLFANNRFSGSDRLGDANQLGLGLVGKIQGKKSGAEVARARIGQIHYFSDQKVGLRSAIDNQQKRSDVVADVRLRLNDRVTLLSEVQFGKRTAFAGGSKHSLFYRTKNQARYGLSFHSLQVGGDEQQSGRAVEKFRQLRFAFDTPIGDSWQAHGAWSQDIRGGRDLELSAGFEYESCCWSIGFFAQRLLVNVSPNTATFSQGKLDYDTRFGLRFSLRGLGSTGGSVRREPGRYFFQN